MFRHGTKSVTVTAVLAILSFTSIFAIAGCGQSRTWSRVTGKALKLELPDDFERPVSFSVGREGEKDLFYESTDGSYRVKTYTDSGFAEAEIVFVKAE